LAKKTLGGIPVSVYSQILAAPQKTNISQEGSSRKVQTSCMIRVMASEGALCGVYLLPHISEGGHEQATTFSFGSVNIAKVPSKHSVELPQFTDPGKMISVNDWIFVHAMISGIRKKIKAPK
jgi:hypothetical protein